MDAQKFFLKKNTPDDLAYQSKNQTILLKAPKTYFLYYEDTKTGDLIATYKKAATVIASNIEKINMFCSIIRRSYIKLNVLVSYTCIL